MVLIKLAAFGRIFPDRINKIYKIFIYPVNPIKKKFILSVNNR